MGTKPLKLREFLLGLENRYWRHALLVIIGFAFLFTAIWSWFVIHIAKGEVEAQFEFIWGLGLVIIALFGLSIYGFFRNRKRFK